MTAPKIMEPVYLGEILAEEFLGPLGISQFRLATEIAVPPRRINEIVHGQRRVSADTALRLARYFDTSERFWLNPAGPLRPRDRAGPVGHCLTRAGGRNRLDLHPGTRCR